MRIIPLKYHKDTKNHKEFQMKKVIALVIALGLTSVFAAEVKAEKNATVKAEKNVTKADKNTTKKAKKAKKEANATKTEKNATK